MSNWTADLRGVDGIFDININFPPGVIDRHSLVLASLTELSQPQGEPLDFPFKGAAVLTLHNLVPFDDGHVEATIDSGWDSPINIRVHFAINPA
jgi:hypothetical protein